MTIKTVFETRKPKPEGFFEALVNRFMEKRLKRLAARHGAQGQRMVIFSHDLMGTQINLYGRGERDEIEDLLLFLAPVMELLKDGVALDVGANVGNHATAFADHFATVLAYEPNPEVHELLVINTRKRPNVRTFNYGLGARRATVRFLEGQGNLGESRVVDAAEAGTAPEGRSVIEVKLERMDDVLSDCNQAVALIKIDVEGHEYQVLEGGVETLSTQSPIVVFEQHRGEFSGGTTPSIELLRSLGYTLCWSEYPRERARFSVVREAMKIADRLTRRRPRIVTGEAVTVKSHSILIAVPARFRAALLG